MRTRLMFIRQAKEGRGRNSTRQKKKGQPVSRSRIGNTVGAIIAFRKGTDGSVAGA